MSKVIITISREFGLGAIEIAEKLAERLEIVCHDKDLIDMTMKKAGITEADADEYDEKLSDSQKSLWFGFGYGSTHKFLSDNAIEKQGEVIQELANKNESAIFLGRCADYFLKDRTETVNFFLYASHEYKVKHIMSEYNSEKIDAEKMLKRIDKQKHNYYKYVTGTNRGDRKTKDFMFDVSKVGKDKTIDIMYDIIKEIMN